jgi:hypothetical protein
VASLKDAQIFLGLTGAYRKFNPDLDVLAGPLNILTTMTKPEFEQHLRTVENRTLIANSMK